MKHRLLSFLLLFAFLLSLASCSPLPSEHSSEPAESDEKESESGGETEDNITVTPSGLRVLIVTDTHYTGTNLNQQVYSKTEGYIQKKASLKYYNNYTFEYDEYGQSSDEKMQRLVDEIVRLYEAGEIDMVMHLGDLAMNDGCYAKFQPENIRYKLDEVKGYAHYGSSLDEFWKNPLNVMYVAKKLFLDQLSAAGIPYFVANGNHDYLMDFSYGRDDLDFTEWERMFHYAELFGHPTDEANGSYVRDQYDDYIYYEDSDSVNYLVRVIRRDGEVKVLSTLDEEDLAYFRETYAGDGNCYDFYVSEESVTDEDELLAAFVFVNGHQFASYKYYVEVGTQNGSQGQTIRYSTPRSDFMHAMLAQTSEYDSVFLMGHLFPQSDSVPYINQYANIQAVFTGDVHTEERYNAGAVPHIVAGQMALPYDIDLYRTADGSPDNQYYYSRHSEPYANRVWSDFARHPYSYVILSVKGNVSDVNRSHLSGFYENGTAKLTGATLTGMDVKYTRATCDPALYKAGSFYYAVAGNAALYTAEELSAAGITSGYRKVYVGGDVSAEGEMNYRILTDEYTLGEFNTPRLRMDLSGNLYTLSGAPLGKKVDKVQIAEGCAVTFEGATYYVCAEAGEIAGHYLYDEKGDFVFVDQNGNYVFYDAIPKRDGYVEASLQEEFMLSDGSAGTLYNGSFERIWFYKNTAGEHVLLDKDGDGLLEDGSYTDLYITKNNDQHAVSGVYTPEIVVENGKIVKGDGWCHFSYAATYSYADGTPVSTDSLVPVHRNGSKIYGLYVPSMDYAEESFSRGE